MSEKESISGFSYTNLSHPSGFKVSESRLTNSVRRPSDESLLQQGNSVNVMGNAHAWCIAIKYNEIR